MAQIKVLRIIARLNIGGPAIHTVLLTAGLDKNIFSPLLISGAVGKGEGDMRYYAEQKGVTPIYIPQLKRELNPFKDLTALIKILRLVVREKPSIIHTHTAKAGTLGRVAGVIYNSGRRLLRPAFGGARNDDGTDKIKLIHTFHGHVFDGYFNSFSTRIFIVIEKILACFTDKIITVSENVKRELISLRIAKNDKIEVVPLGFELERFLEVTPRVKAETVNIGIIGRLAPIKNHHLFLEAARRLRRGFANSRLGLVNESEPFNARFVIVGDGELRDELEEYSRKLNLSEFVEFSGWQDNLPKVYADLDIVCLTSLNEGTPVSLIEAMASGRAVVATAVGGVTDLLGEEIQMREAASGEFTVRQRGIAVKSKDANGFANALEFMLRNETLRKNLSEAGREYAKDTFSQKRLIQDIENLYLKALKI